MNNNAVKFYMYILHRYVHVNVIGRVGTSIVQPVNSSGKCRKLQALQILQKSLRWQILAFMNKIKLKTCKIKTYYLILQKNDTGINHLLK